MPHPRPTWPLAILLVIMLLSAAYMGAYYAMLDYSNMATATDGFIDVIYIEPPEYRFGGQVMSWIFFPAHLADAHLIRPSRWIDPSEVDYP